MYSLTHVKRDSPPKPTLFLNLRVLCGRCNYKCCNSPSLNVECTPTEATALQLPVVFPQAGHCRCLRAAGCVHGPARPVFCKLFPLQITKDNKLIVSHWSILNCPMAHDYELMPHDEEKSPKAWRHCYLRRDNISGAKRNNSYDALAQPTSLNTWPTALEMGREALEELYGPAGYKQIADGLALLNQTRKGFGLNG